MALIIQIVVEGGGLKNTHTSITLGTYHSDCCGSEWTEKHTHQSHLALIIQTVVEVGGLISTHTPITLGTFPENGVWLPKMAGHKMGTHLKVHWKSELYGHGSVSLHTQTKCNPIFPGQRKSAVSFQNYGAKPPGHTPSPH